MCVSNVKSTLDGVVVSNLTVSLLYISQICTWGDDASTVEVADVLQSLDMNHSCRVDYEHFLAAALVSVTKVHAHNADTV